MWLAHRTRAGLGEITGSEGESLEAMKKKTPEYRKKILRVLKEPKAYSDAETEFIELIDPKNSRKLRKDFWNNLEALKRQDLVEQLPDKKWVVKDTGKNRETRDISRTMEISEKERMRFIVDSTLRSIDEILRISDDDAYFYADPEKLKDFDQRTIGVICNAYNLRRQRYPIPLPGEFITESCPAVKPRLFGVEYITSSILVSNPELIYMARGRNVYHLSPIGTTRLVLPGPSQLVDYLRELRITLSRFDEMKNDVEEYYSWMGVYLESGGKRIPIGDFGVGSINVRISGRFVSTKRKVFVVSPFAYGDSVL
jgi:hypothetical protein